MAGIAELQHATKGDRSVCIAVIDGPVDLSHPCFAGADLQGVGVSQSLGHEKSRTALSHGTHVASVMFGQPGTSVLGVVPGCRGLIVPIFKDDPEGAIAPCSEMDLARAITHAIERGAQIINVSGGRLDRSGQAGPFLTDAVNEAADRGILIVAAGGNDGCECLHVPAAMSNVIAVGAMDAKGDPLPASNWGQKYQEQGVLALGEDVIGAVPGGGSAAFTGTSFAAPIVSGVAGLLLSLQRQSGEPPDAMAVRDALIRTVTACDPQSRGDCRRHLGGTLNVAAARAAIEGAGPGPPRTPAETPSEDIVPSAFDNGRRDPMTTVGEQHDPSPAALSNTAPGSSVVAPQPLSVDRADTGSSCSPLDGSEQQNDATAISPRAGGLGTPEQPVTPSGAEKAAGVAPSACCSSCAAAEQAQRIYVLGHLGYDFGTEARMDSIQLEMGDANAFVASDLLEHLDSAPESATGIIWTLNLDLTPIYAIQPSGPFGAETYAFLREALKEQLPVKGKKEIDVSERVSIPGVITGEARLLNGMSVPIITPELRGMFNWSTKALVQELKALTPKESGDQAYDPFDGLENFLRRIYEECRNLGVSPQDRAKNYAATNAYSLQNIFAAARSQQMHLEVFSVEKSPICRPDSDCWDIQLKFYYPKELWNRARDVWIMTVDVSDIVPVVVGAPRHWTTI